MAVEVSLLASHWANKFHSNESIDSKICRTLKSIENALERTIPLLMHGDEVPFLCRYRRQAVHPLDASEVHQLRKFVEQHKALESPRKKCVKAMQQKIKSTGKGQQEFEDILKRIQVCTSKSTLDGLYAPFKPPPKGSISDRITSSYPDIVEKVEDFWNQETTDETMKFLEKILRNNHNALNTDSALQKKMKKEERSSNKKIEMSPRECAIYLLANKIASSQNITEAIIEYVKKKAVVVTKQKRKKEPNMTKKAAGNKFEGYHEFSRKIVHLKDYQVLAIRRGVNVANELSMTNSIPDDEYLKRQMQQILLRRNQNSSNGLKPMLHYFNRSHRIKAWINDAIEDSWKRLLKKRSTTFVWAEKVKEAENRGIAVFTENLWNALMKPPQIRKTFVLAMDPGFKAGIKVALLNPYGELLEDDNPISRNGICTIHFLGNENKRMQAIEKLSGLLNIIKKHIRLNAVESCYQDKDSVIVALGNGHGCDEAKNLIEDASKSCDIPVKILMIDEAGVSVWSVTQNALKEFEEKRMDSVSIGAISIGRRLQDPMNELVKVPPRSLGLGMYQHDLPEKELEESLSNTSIDAVAAVGVDINSCSLELLKNVPGLSRGKLAENVIATRPFSSRQDLKNVKGLGEKTFQNCAGFIRLRKEDALNELDTTRVHPESYHIASWIVKKLKCNVKGILDKLPSQEKDRNKFDVLVESAAQRHNESEESIRDLIELMISSANEVDPRLIAKNSAQESQNEDQFTELTSEYRTNFEALRDACPLRGIRGVVRNITDFGAFVDIGTEQSGLLHISKAGPSGLNNLFVGKSIGVDVLNVSVESGKISLALSGIGLETKGLEECSKKRKYTNSKETSISKKRKKHI